MVNRMRILLCLLAALLPATAWASDVSVAFSPSAGATELVVHTINSAQTSIRVAA
jgi:hypothetical protein